MKLLSYEEGGAGRVAAVDDGRLIDVNRAFADLRRRAGSTEAAALADATVPAEMTRLLAGGEPALAALREAVDHVAGLDPEAARRDLLVREPDQVDLLPVVPAPPKIVCVARNYSAHAREAGLELPTLPILFARFPATLVAAGAPIVRPRVSEQLDWEGELALVIGKGGRYVTREAAFDHIAGYTIFNDVTVRDYQFRVPQYTAGKNFAASGPLGPHLVLAGDSLDPEALDVATEVNGVEKQRANTADMIFDLPTLIEHVSEFIDLEPGDVIATGTPAGVGFKREPPEFLRPGDTVKVTITGIGELENPVIEEDGR